MAIPDNPNNLYKCPYAHKNLCNVNALYREFCLFKDLAMAGFEGCFKFLAWVKLCIL